MGRVLIFNQSCVCHVIKQRRSRDRLIECQRHLLCGAGAFDLRPPSSGWNRNSHQDNYTRQLFFTGQRHNREISYSFFFLTRSPWFKHAPFACVIIRTWTSLPRPATYAIHVNSANPQWLLLPQRTNERHEPSQQQSRIVPWPNYCYGISCPPGRPVCLLTVQLIVTCPT